MKNVKETDKNIKSESNTLKSTLIVLSAFILIGLLIAVEMYSSKR
jgi:hypothetical protein